MASTSKGAALAGWVLWRSGQGRASGWRWSGVWCSARLNPWPGTSSSSKGASAGQDADQLADVAGWVLVLGWVVVLPSFDLFWNFQPLPRLSVYLQPPPRLQTACIFMVLVQP